VPYIVSLPALGTPHRTDFGHKYGPASAVFIPRVARVTCCAVEV